MSVESTDMCQDSSCRQLIGNFSAQEVTMFQAAL
jgi:hypothetical protein